MANGAIFNCNSVKILYENGYISISDVINISDLSKDLVTGLTCTGEMKNETIKGLTNLVSLDLGLNDNITDDGIKGLINLTYLNLGNNGNITVEGPKNLINLTYFDCMV